MIIAYEVDGSCRNERFLRISNQVEIGIHPIQLIIRDGAYRLFSHSALVSVSWRLVMFRERNKASQYSKYRRWFDLEVRGCGCNLRFVHGDVCVVLLVDIHVLDEPLCEKIVELDGSLLQLLQEECRQRARQAMTKAQTNFDMFVRNPCSHILHDDHGATDTTSVTGDIHRIVQRIHVYTDKSVHDSSPP